MDVLAWILQWAWSHLTVTNLLLLAVLWHVVGDVDRASRVVRLPRPKGSPDRLAGGPPARPLVPS